VGHHHAAPDGTASAPTREPATSIATTATAEMLHRAQDGDRDAFAGLYRRYVGNVERYIYVRIRGWDRDAVPDLVQDTFCLALAELHAAGPDIQGWLIGLAAKACTRHTWAQRRYLRAALALGEAATLPTYQPSTEPSTQPSMPGSPDRTFGQAPFAHALARLAPRERRAIQLRYLDGLARSVTAQLMATTPGTVRALERRALHQLRLSLTTPDALTTDSRRTNR
jgi:RNA polymerase sigma-70 factor (ECF subfamily)